MDQKWQAEVVNDPERDYDLSVEIYEGPHHRATVSRKPSGEIVLTWFPTEATMDVPAMWLVGVVQRAENELPESNTPEAER